MSRITANPIPETIPQSSLGISFEAIAQIPRSDTNNNQVPRLNFIQSPKDGSGRLFLSVRSFWERFWNYQRQNRTCSDRQKVLTSKIKYVVSPHEKN